MRIIATRDDSNWYLVDEQEFISTDEELKAMFLEYNWAKPYDDTKPRPPQGGSDYEPGFSYPKNRYVYKDGDIIKSNCITNTSFIGSEWDNRVVGV